MVITVEFVHDWHGCTILCFRTMWTHWSPHYNFVFKRNVSFSYYRENKIHLPTHLREQPENSLNTREILRSYSNLWVQRPLTNPVSPSNLCVLYQRLFLNIINFYCVYSFRHHHLKQNSTLFMTSSLKDIWRQNSMKFLDLWT